MSTAFVMGDKVRTSFITISVLTIEPVSDIQENFCIPG
ncbi:hypothetical protein FM107_11380 [Sphingobacterium sp. JB170]|nr:hypothetical protein FM107_11380 [Sphingobacterium sp. JB170]